MLYFIRAKNSYFFDGVDSCMIVQVSQKNNLGIIIKSVSWISKLKVVTPSDYAVLQIRQIIVRKDGHLGI